MESPQDVNTAAPSLLYTILPQAVQCRIPRVPSFRKTAVAYAYPGGHSRTSSTDSNGLITPPPLYSTRPPSPLLASLEDDDDGDDTTEVFRSAPTSRPSTSSSMTPSPMKDIAPGHWEEDGIGSKNARRGLRMLDLASQELESDKALSRKLYVDGVGYLLQGLPSELQPEEEVVLKVASGALLVGMPAQMELVRPTEEPVQQPQSVVHSVMVTSTFYAILAISVIVPYAQAFARQVWTVDRKYRVTDRCLQQGTLLLQIVGAQVLSLAALVWNLNDGQLRELCRDMGVWIARDISGGAHEGVGKAIERLRLDEKRKD